MLLPQLTVKTIFFSFLLLFLNLLRSIQKLLKRLFAIPQKFASENALFSVCSCWSKSLDSELETHDSATKLGVKVSVSMFGLRFSKDGLHYDVLLANINFEVRILFIETGFIFCYAIAEHQTTQLWLLLFVVVWSDLIQPKTDCLSVVFLYLSLLLVDLSFFLQLNTQFILCLSPLWIGWPFNIVVAIFIAPSLSDFTTHTFTSCTPTISWTRLV